MHATRLLVLLFIPTIYYHIISNSRGVMACTRFWLQGRYLHLQSGSCLSCTWHAYWSSIPTKYNQNMSKGIKIIWSIQGCVYGQTDTMLIALSPEPIGRGIKIDEICPLAIQNQISTISMHSPSLVNIHCHLLNLWSGNENTDGRTTDRWMDRHTDNQRDINNS